MYKRMKRTQLGHRVEPRAEAEYTLGSLPSSVSSCPSLASPAACPTPSQPVLRHRYVSHIQQRRLTVHDTPRRARGHSGGIARGTNSLMFKLSSWMQSLLELGRQGVTALRDFFP